MIRKVLVLAAVFALIVGAVSVSAQTFTNSDGLVFNYDAATYTVSEAAGSLSIMNNRTFQTYIAHFDDTALGMAGAMTQPADLDAFIAGYNRIFGVAQTLDLANAVLLDIPAADVAAVPYTLGGLKGIVVFGIYDAGHFLLLDGVSPMATHQALFDEASLLVGGMSYGGSAGPVSSDPNAAPLIRLTAPITPAELPAGVGIIGNLAIFEYPADFRVTTEASATIFDLLTLNAFPSGTNVAITLGEASDLVNGQTWKTMFVSGLATAAGDANYNPATSWTTLAGSLPTAAAAGSLSGAAQTTLNQASASLGSLSGAAQQGLNQAQSALNQASASLGSLSGAAQQGLNQAQSALNQASASLSGAAQQAATQVPAALGSLTGGTPTTPAGAGEYPVVEVYQALNPNGLSVLAYVVTLNADLYITVNVAAVNAGALEDQRPALDAMALSMRLITPDDVMAYGLDAQ